MLTGNFAFAWLFDFGEIVIPNKYVKMKKITKKMQENLVNQFIFCTFAAKTNWSTSSELINYNNIMRKQSVSCLCIMLIISIMGVGRGNFFVCCCST